MQADVRIRRAGAGDGAAIASVLRQAFLEFEPLRQGALPRLRRMRSKSCPGSMKAGLDASVAGQLVGTASVVGIGGKGLYVRGVAVAPSARGQGIAQSLMREIESFATSRGYRRLYLTTTPFLNGAICLYERFGFTHVPDGADDLFGTPLLRMAKPL